VKRRDWVAAVRKTVFYLVTVVALGAVGVLLIALAFYNVGYVPKPVEDIAPEMKPWATAEGTQLKTDVVRIMSLNLNHGAGNSLPLESGFVRKVPEKEVEARLDALVELVQRERVDVLALQGVDFGSALTGGVDQVEYLASKLRFGYMVKARTWKHPYLPFPDPLAGPVVGEVDSGLAVISRLPVGDAERYSLPDETMDSWWQTAFASHYALLKVDLSSRGRHLVLFTTALTQGAANARESQAREAGRLVADNGGGKGLLAGSLFSGPVFRKEGMTGPMDVSYNLVRSRRNFVPLYSDWDAVANPARYATRFTGDGPGDISDHILPEHGVRVARWSIVTGAELISAHRPMLAEVVL